MSSVPVEAVEPSVAALTDIGNGDDGKKDLSAGAPTTDVDLVEAGSTATKQSDVAREEKTEKEVAKKGEAENGNSTRERKHQHSKKYDNGFRRKNNSKYDPKVLEITSDHAEIIKQVCDLSLAPHFMLTSIARSNFTSVTRIYLQTITCGCSLMVAPINLCPLASS